MGHPVLERLPEVHVVALLLAAAGSDKAEIAIWLDIPQACVDPLLAIARNKLARALACGPPTPP